MGISQCGSQKLSFQMIVPSLEMISHPVCTSHPLRFVSSLYTDSESARIHEAGVISQQLGLDGLRCLQTLLTFLSPVSGASCHSAFLSAISFTSSRDPWTTTSSQSIATDILRENVHEVEGPEFIIDFLLQSIIRPLFSKSKPAAITAAGRKAMPSSAPPRNYNISESLDPARKPWKYTSPFSIAVLEWAVTKSSVNNPSSLPIKYCYTNSYLIRKI